MAVDRTQFIRSLVKQGGKGLEIGPSHAPLFPKSGGFDVKILDYTDANGLRNKYAGAGVNLEAIEEVDYVSDGRSISDIVKDEKFDFVVSSHALEHVTDVIGYLQSCERILVGGGRAVLALPDKRHTFDAFQNTTTLGELLDARGAVRHSPGRTFDFVSQTCHLDNRETWDATFRGTVSLPCSLEQAQHWHDLSSQEAYVDIHAWRFTPASFRLLIHDINALGLCGLKVDVLHSENIFEFYVSLSHEARRDDDSRIDLFRAVLKEQVLSGIQLLNATLSIS